MKKDQPVIIIKKGGHGHGGHHGGAWKVAYADFVTAMMAFFLVMWLVSQKQEVRAAVGGYFRDPSVFNAQGEGILPGAKTGVDPSGTPTAAPPEEAAAEAEKKRLETAAEHIKEKLVEKPEFSSLRDQIEMTITTEGLRIELSDRSGSSFFDSGSALMRGESSRILSVIASEIGKLDNDVFIEGHTDSRPYTDQEQYTNWELSADRANAARRVMMHEGIRGEQLKGVRGYADTQLHIPADAKDPRNRRVSILVRSQAAAKTEKIAERINEKLAEAPQAH
ncbi:MAG: OmpA family protein [Acidobacteria bacterium]|nr:OmpA family protein [Acidobacteriota bacterium]